MKFQSRTEEEIEKERLLPEGTYPFTVKTAVETKSKKGNDMIALDLIIHSDRGDWNMKDWLLAAFALKLCHFCRHMGLEDKYKDGTLTAEDCDQRQGFCKITQEPGQGNFGPQNRVDDYVEMPVSMAGKPRPASAAGATDEDDIPFSPLNSVMAGIA